jgi:hypothetical protein
MTLFSHPEFDNHEHLSFFCDPETGLKAIVAIHNTSRGSAFENTLAQLKHCPSGLLAPGN